MVLTKQKVYIMFFKKQTEKTSLIVCLKNEFFKSFSGQIKSIEASKMSELVLISRNKFPLLAFESKKSRYFLIIYNQYF